MANHPIFAPTFRGDIVAVSKILNEDATHVTLRDAKNLTPLHVAASRGQHEIAQLLLDYGADIDGPSGENQWTPLVFACYRGHVDVVVTLIENGAGVTSDDGNPIHYAGQRKHKEICRILVEHGAIDDLVNSNDTDTLNVFRAAYSYDADTVNEILARRPELIDRKDKNGRTLLHEACTHGDIKTVRALLRLGANATILDGFDQTPADRASAHGQHAVTKLLRKHENAG